MHNHKSYIYVDKNLYKNDYDHVSIEFPMLEVCAFKKWPNFLVPFCREKRADIAK